MAPKITDILWDCLRDFRVFRLGALGRTDGWRGPKACSKKLRSRSSIISRLFSSRALDAQNHGRQFGVLHSISHGVLPSPGSCGRILKKDLPDDLCQFFSGEALTRAENCLRVTRTSSEDMTRRLRGRMVDILCDPEFPRFHSRFDRPIPRACRFQQPIAQLMPGRNRLRCLVSVLWRTPHSKPSNALLPKQAQRGRA